MIDVLHEAGVVERVLVEDMAGRGCSAEGHGWRMVVVWAQHYGNGRDEEENLDLTPEEVLKRFDPLLKDLDQEIAKAEKWLVGWYENLKPSVVLNIEGAVAD